ncbi:MAG: hemerythrin domain-containing protein [Betaproteobacteria bacterium]|nr:hemerythrin domain-containing protein [Betaproteobacteria bacterium]
MEWKESFTLGVKPMDDTHREFVDMVSHLETLPDDSLLAGMDELVEHTAAHFDQENRWMEESGFPPVHCHTEEHKRVMQVMRDVRGHVAAGDHALGRNLIRELPEWFATHAATMYTALVWFMQQKGYVPEGATA